MTDKKNPHSHQLIDLHQQRAVSFGDAPLQMDSDVKSDTYDETQTTKDNQHIDQTDKNDYMTRTSDQRGPRRLWLVLDVVVSE